MISLNKFRLDQWSSQKRKISKSQKRKISKKEYIKNMKSQKRKISQNLKMTKIAKMTNFGNAVKCSVVLHASVLTNPKRALLILHFFRRSS